MYQTWAIYKTWFTPKCISFNADLEDSGLLSTVNWQNFSMIHGGFKSLLVSKLKCKYHPQVHVDFYELMKTGPNFYWQPPWHNKAMTSQNILTGTRNFLISSIARPNLAWACPGGASTSIRTWRSSSRWAYFGSPEARSSSSYNIKSITVYNRARNFLFNSLVPSDKYNNYVFCLSEPQNYLSKNRQPQQY